MSELPSILAYPPILDVDQVPELTGPGPPRHLAYVLRAYPEDGLTVVIKRDPTKDAVNIVLGDWDGANIITGDKLDGIALKFMAKDASLFVGLMKALKLTQAIFYISYDNGELRLVDIRLSLDKFCGPGMVRDLFGKIYPTQDIVKVVPLDEAELVKIKNGMDPYVGDLIIKCSTFKTIVRDKDLLPLYARVRHQT